LLVLIGFCGGFGVSSVCFLKKKPTKTQQQQQQQQNPTKPSCNEV